MARSFENATQRQKRNPMSEALLVNALFPRDASQFLLQPLRRLLPGIHAGVGSFCSLSDRRCSSTRLRSCLASASLMSPAWRASEMAWRTKSILPLECSRSATVRLIVVSGMPSSTVISSGDRSCRWTTTPFGFCRRSLADSARAPGLHGVVASLARKIVSRVQSPGVHRFRLDS